VLDRLIEAARAGESRALVVRGEPGVGKMALLDYQEMAMSAKHTGDEHVVLCPRNSREIRAPCARGRHRAQPAPVGLQGLTEVVVEVDGY
jgi:hypothetical protein